MAETPNLGTKNESNENPSGEVEELEEDVPPRKKLRLEKKLRNAEFLFRRRKRDIYSKMRQYESELNKTTRQNNSLQQQVSLSSFYEASGTFSRNTSKFFGKLPISNS